MEPNKNIIIVTWPDDKETKCVVCYGKEEARVAVMNLLERHTPEGITVYNVDGDAMSLKVDWE